MNIFRAKFFRECRWVCCTAACHRIKKKRPWSNSSAGKFKILVATTVIEVGVDVPNATVMVVEQAERFGLAQLHQLRGRVGRGAAQSYCILVTEKLGDTARERIRTLVDTSDGFQIAEMDLKLRGPGEFFGTKQSGLPSLRVANILRDQEILEASRREAQDFLAHPPSPGDLARAGVLEKSLAAAVRTGAGRLSRRPDFHPASVSVSAL